MNLLQKKQKECHTINIEMNVGFGSLNKTEPTPNPDSIPPHSSVASTLTRNPNPDFKTRCSHRHFIKHVVYETKRTFSSTYRKRKVDRNGRYPCISDFKNEINQRDSLGNGTRGRGHVRAVPASATVISGCLLYRIAYLPCQSSRCHFGWKIQKVVRTLLDPRV